MRSAIVSVVLSLVLLVSANPLFAQMNPSLWLLQDAHVPSNEMVHDFVPVSDLVCWAATVDTNNKPPSGFIRTTDGGNTWIYGRIPDAPDGIIWQIAPVDADTAYAAVSVQPPSQSKGIYKTTDGGGWMFTPHLSTVPPSFGSSMH